MPVTPTEIANHITEQKERIAELQARKALWETITDIVRELAEWAKETREREKKAEGRR